MSDLFADPPPGEGDLSRFIEDGEGFVLVDPGDPSQDLPVYDWDAEEETTVREEASND